MSNIQKILLRIAETFIVLLIAIGLLVQVVAVPLISSSLSDEYTEYSNDRIFIQVMLTSIILTGQLSLGFVLLLLRRVRTARLLNQDAFKWVSLLSASLFVVAATFSFLLFWLVGKNTLPPALGGGLIGAILLSATMGLVTVALKGVLRGAVAAQTELEGVI